MKMNLWSWTHGTLPNAGAETQQAIEQNYVFFTATMRAVEIEAALNAIQRTAAEVRAEPSAPAPPPAGGEPDVEPVSRYDTFMQHFRTVAPDCTDQEIADHSSLLSLLPSFLLRSAPFFPARAAFRCARGSPPPPPPPSPAPPSLSLSLRRPAGRPRYRPGCGLATGPRRGIGAPLTRFAVAAPRTRRPAPPGRPGGASRRPRA